MHHSLTKRLAPKLGAFVVVGFAWEVLQIWLLQLLSISSCSPGRLFCVGGPANLAPSPLPLFGPISCCAPWAAILRGRSCKFGLAVPGLCLGCDWTFPGLCFGGAWAMPALRLSCAWVAVVSWPFFLRGTLLLYAVVVPDPYICGVLTTLGGSWVWGKQEAL